MRLIELTVKGEPYTLNLEHVSDILSLKNGGTRFVQTMLENAGTEDEEFADIEADEPYNEVMMVIRETWPGEVAP